MRELRRAVHRIRCRSRCYCICCCFYYAGCHNRLCYRHCRHGLNSKRHRNLMRFRRRARLFNDMARRRRMRHRLERDILNRERIRHRIDYRSSGRLFDHGRRDGLMRDDRRCRFFDNRGRGYYLCNRFLTGRNRQCGCN